MIYIILSIWVLQSLSTLFLLTWDESSFDDISLRDLISLILLSLIPFSFIGAFILSYRCLYTKLNDDGYFSKIVVPRRKK